MRQPVAEDEVGNEKAHAGRVGSGRGSVETSLARPAYHLLLVAVRPCVAAAVGKRAHVVVVGVEHRPNQVTELLDTLEIGQEACRLGPIAVRKLALVPGYRP